MILYRLALTLLSPVVLLWLIWRVLSGRDQTRDVAQRLGFAERHAPGGIWVHGASNGEIVSGRALIEALQIAFPGRQIIVTANNKTAVLMVRAWHMAGVNARLAPLDYRLALWGFHRRVRPAAMLMLENEIWPNRIVTARVPLAVISARVSDKAARVWARFGPVTRAVGAHMGLVLPQDRRSAECLISMGVPKAVIGQIVTLKADVAMALPAQSELLAFQRVFERSKTVLAASTHPGEDAIILNAFEMARQERPGLKLILAPRHPARADEIAELLDEARAKWARRSTGGAVSSDTAILLADTLGEMPLWYALCSVVIVAGSLVDKGGHTPFEPAGAGCAVLHGPYVANFADVYQALDGAGGGICVGTASELASALVQMGNDADRAAMVKAAKMVAADFGAEKGIDLVISYLKTNLS